METLSIDIMGSLPGHVGLHPPSPPFDSPVIYNSFVLISCSLFFKDYEPLQIYLQTGSYGHWRRGCTPSVSIKFYWFLYKNILSKWLSLSISWVRFFKSPLRLRKMLPLLFSYPLFGDVTLSFLWFALFDTKYLTFRTLFVAIPWRLIISIETIKIVVVFISTKGDYYFTSCTLLFLYLRISINSAINYATRLETCLPLERAHSCL